MSTVVTILLVVLCVILIIAEAYFTVGPGRRMTIGNANHWWNRPLGRNARRIVGVVVTLGMVGVLIYDLLHPRERSLWGPAPSKDVLDVILIVLGILIATGVLPRRRSPN